MWILYYLWQCRKSFINNTRTCWVFWSWVEKGQCRFTANYCRNKNAYVGVEKGLQKLTVVESIKSAEQRREELATVKPAEQQDECESGAALLSCCGCAELCARMGISQQGTLGTSQHRSGRSHQSAGWQWAYEDGDHKIQMAVKSWHLPESQLTDLRWIQKWFRPGTKTGTQVGVLFYHYFSFTLFMGPESTFLLLLLLPPAQPHPSKDCQTLKDRKQELPFEVAGLFQQQALAVRGRKREKTVSNPEMFPDACFWQGRQ